MSGLVKHLRRFRSEEDGTAAIELLLTLPILVWALLSTLVYFDVYRAEAVSTRAGLTIADMFSREDDTITATYIDSAREILRTLTEAEENPDLRVTVFLYRGVEMDYRVVWSYNRGMGSNLTHAGLNDLKSQLPLMTDGQRAILVQTNVQYSAPFSIGLTPFVTTSLNDLAFPSFTVISPRFASSVCYDTTPSDPATGLRC